MNLPSASRNWVCSSVSSMDLPSHPSNAKGSRTQHAMLGLPTYIEREAENLARLARIDDSVVPQSGRREERRGLRFDHLLNRSCHLFDRLRIERLACPLHLRFSEKPHDLCRLRSPHESDATVGPCKNEARTVRSSAH